MRVRWLADVKAQRRGLRTPGIIKSQEGLPSQVGRALGFDDLRGRGGRRAEVDRALDVRTFAIDRRLFVDGWPQPNGQQVGAVPFAQAWLLHLPGRTVEERLTATLSHLAAEKVSEAERKRLTKALETAGHRRAVPLATARDAAACLLGIPPHRLRAWRHQRRWTSVDVIVVVTPGLGPFEWPHRMARTVTKKTGP